MKKVQNFRLDLEFITKGVRIILSRNILQKVYTFFGGGRIKEEDPYASLE